MPEVKRIIRALASEQPVERASTLADVRAEVLAPSRLTAFVISGFAGVALLIAAVGVAGVLAFSVSTRFREFGVRLAIGATPRRLLLDVLREGALVVVLGVACGAAGGYAFSKVAARFVDVVRPAGGPALLAAALVLVAAGVLASLLPAARAARVNVAHALRSE